MSSEGGASNNESILAAVSSDGRFVAFESRASNLVPNDLNGQRDVFVHDRQTGETSRVSVSSSGVAGNAFASDPAISPVGRYVAFYSNASNLVSGDDNGQPDSFVKDRVTGEIELVSVAMSGEPGNGPSDITVVSADGRFVCFGSVADDLVPGDFDAPGDSLGPGDHKEEHDVFVRDRLLGTTTHVGGGLAGAAGVPQLAGSGLLIGATNGALALTAAATRSPAHILIATGSAPAPFKGGELLAFPPLVVVPAFTDGSGDIALPFVWPAGLPPGVALWLQVLVADDRAPEGIAISTCAVAITP